MRNTVVFGSCNSRTRSASGHAERVFMRRMRRSARCTLRMASLMRAYRVGEAAPNESGAAGADKDAGKLGLHETHWWRISVVPENGTL